MTIDEDRLREAYEAWGVALRAAHECETTAEAALEAAGRAREAELRARIAYELSRYEAEAPKGLTVSGTPCPVVVPPIKAAAIGGAEASLTVSGGPGQSSGATRVIVDADRVPKEGPVRSAMSGRGFRQLEDASWLYEGAPRGCETRYKWLRAQGVQARWDGPGEPKM